MSLGEAWDGAGMAERHQAGVIIAHPVHRARAQPPHQAHKAVFAADLRRPAVQVAAESHPGGVRQIVLPKALALNHLDQDRHALVVILQALGAPVEQGIWVENAGIDADDRLGQARQVFSRRVLVWAEVAFVFPGKRGAEVIFQQAGRAHDQWFASDQLEQAAQLFHELGRKLARQEILLQLGVFGADLLFGFVFLVAPVHELVEAMNS